MRTTITIDDRLLEKARELAARTKKTLSQVIEAALRESLSRRSSPSRPKKVRLTTVGGNGPRPGVDIDDSASLLDLMDRDA